MEGLTRSRIYQKPYFNRSPLLVLKILIIRGRKFLLTIFFVLLFYFLLLEFLEKWSVIDTAWFLIATISTVGYGDTVPHDQLGRLLVIILIGISIIAIATLSTIIFETVSTVSKPQFLNDYSLQQVKYHVIIVGGTNLATIIADNFLEMGIIPVLVDTTLPNELTSQYLSVTGELRSAETFVKAMIEHNCIGVIITTKDDTDKINAAITVRSLYKELPVLVILEVRQRIEVNRPLPQTIFSDLNLTVIDSEELLANEIAKYLHLDHFNKELNDFILFNLRTTDYLSEFPSDALLIPSEAVEYLDHSDLDLELLGYSKIGTADFSIGYPKEADKLLSHLFLVGSQDNINAFRRSFCTLNKYQLPNNTLILGFGETSKILLPVLTQTTTKLTVLDIHEEKILEAQKFHIDKFITADFFSLYGLDSQEPFDYDLVIINMPKILAMAALARIKKMNSTTKIVVPVPDIIDAPYFYDHGANLVLVRSQLTAEAVIKKSFFPNTSFFGNGSLEFMDDLPSISVKDVELKMKGRVLAIYPHNAEDHPLFYPLKKNQLIDKNDKILFFHESIKIARAKYGH